MERNGTADGAIIIKYLQKDFSQRRGGAKAQRGRKKIYRKISRRGTEDCVLLSNCAFSTILFLFIIKMNRKNAVSLRITYNSLRLCVSAPLRE
jgi:hypothetical protein